MNKTDTIILKAGKKLNKDAAKAAKKLTKAKQLYNSEQELILMCYEQYSKYHFRIFKDGNIVDVWPTSKKYWGPKMGSSIVYKHPSEVLKVINSQ
jgi:hypothetical protein